jgi:hypothetical protein
MDVLFYFFTNFLTMTFAIPPVLFHCKRNQSKEEEAEEERSNSSTIRRWLDVLPGTRECNICNLLVFSNTECKFAKVCKEKQ